MDGITDPRGEKLLLWIDRLIEGGILLFVFLFPIKEFIVSDDVIAVVKWAALYVPLGLWILKMFILKDFSLVRTPIDRPILLYSIVVSASLLYSIDRIETLAGIRGSYLKAIALYFVILNNFQTQEKVKRIGLTFAISFVLTIGIGFFNYQIGLYNGIGGITAFANMNHNTMGNILGEYFPFLLFAFSSAKKPAWKGIAVLLIMMGLFAVFMTLSRSAWGGAIFTFLIWGMFHHWKMVTAVLVLFLFILFSLGPASVAQRLALFQDQKSTMSGRIPIWKMAIEKIKERPLLGYGYGLNIFEKLYGEWLADQPKEEKRVPRHEHNLFLSLLIQNGLIGMALYFWIFVGALVLIYKRILSIAVGLDRDILIVIFSAMIGEYFFHSLLERNNVGNAALPLWTMLALAMAIWNRVGEDHLKNAFSKIKMNTLVNIK